MHLLADFRGRRTFAARLYFETKGNVLEHRHVTKQSIVLKHESDLAGANRPPSCVTAVEQHPTLIRCLETGDDPQQGGLAAARRAEQRNQRACRNFQINVLNGGKFTKLLGYAP